MALRVAQQLRLRDHELHAFVVRLRLDVAQDLPAVLEPVHLREHGRLAHARRQVLLAAFDLAQPLQGLGVLPVVFGELREVQVRAVGIALLVARFREQREIPLQVAARIGLEVALHRQQRHRVDEGRILRVRLQQAFELPARGCVLLVGDEQARIRQPRLGRLRVSLQVARQQLQGAAAIARLHELRGGQRGALRVGGELDGGLRFLDRAAVQPGRLRAIGEHEPHFGRLAVGLREPLEQREGACAILAARQRALDAAQLFRGLGGRLQLLAEDRMGLVELAAGGVQHRHRLARFAGMRCEFMPQLRRFEALAERAALQREFGGASREPRIARVASKLEVHRVRRAQFPALGRDFRRHQLVQQRAGQVDVRDVVCLRGLSGGGGCRLPSARGPRRRRSRGNRGSRNLESQDPRRRRGRARCGRRTALGEAGIRASGRPRRRRTAGGEGR